ncbi:M20/M25/M40 family metallo-hydrolase [Salisediminibacterium beveridgei]|uniref:Peptidase T-Like Protein n=1 Tax=Salisediminibacterium beveridgei TaxID=632773 RepID=A0A1D7QX56_9BACI|nr:M20/M25/M40 family metallo-hydrolase [Salisediminibacterium beveridgei]AOM83586.1 Peptidase T-Like Protein [Salisediminibacterium beveridgei]
MKQLEQQLQSYGFMVRVNDEGILDMREESEVNRLFFNQIISQSGLGHAVDSQHKCFTLSEQSELEKAIKQAFNWSYRGNHENSYLFETADDVMLEHLDFSIAGLVRQLNRLGLTTSMSCEGHSSWLPHIRFVSEEIADRAIPFLQAAGIYAKKSEQNHLKIELLSNDQQVFLDAGLYLAQLQPDDVPASRKSLMQERLEQRLREVLAIPGVSGDEGQIRTYVMAALKRLTSDVKVDDYGNVLGSIHYGEKPSRPVILVNAHLDIVRELVPSRKVVETDDIWSSNLGILGADDRAGVAIILEALGRVKQILKASGTIKVIFTVEEEIGLRGAKAVDPSFLRDVDAAIVIDRRGNSDIVTGNSFGDVFCDDEYGKWIESVACIHGHTGWRCVPGGNSDTRIWSSYGINSVNLSAGYQNEHSSQETLDVLAAGDTLKLLTQLLLEQGSLYRTLMTIRRKKRSLLKT